MAAVAGEAQHTVKAVANLIHPERGICDDDGNMGMAGLTEELLPMESSLGELRQEENLS